MKFTYNITHDIESIKTYLQEKYYSKKLIAALIYQGGKILVNGINKKMSTSLYKGDRLEVYLPEEKLTDHFPSSNKNIIIIYEDEYLLAVSKPPHLETIPSRLNNDDTLSNRVKFYYDTNKINSNIHVVNRLDKETSGLVIIAKSRYIHHLFSNHLEITKKYLAIVEGSLSDQLIEANIKRADNKQTKRIVAPDGQYAKTKVKVLCSYHNLSLIECKLYTGRTHQIRVHLSHISHPILGDNLYGGRSSKRLYLHCHALTFQHPVLDKTIILRNTPGEFYEKYFKKNLSEPLS